MPKAKTKTTGKTGKKAKPKIGFFDLSGCNGCLLSVAFNEEDLLDMAEHLDIQSFRFIVGKSSDNYDIAFVEGLVSDNSDLEKLLKIRKNAKILIALGTCAHTGCIPAYRNFINPNKFANMVYDRRKDLKDTLPLPICEHVKVDFTIPGCPPDRKQIKDFVKDLLLGKMPLDYDKPVCFECRMNENKCVLIEEGKPCLGPITKGGCNSICTNSGFECWGCRGATPDANREMMVKLLQEKGFKKGFIDKRMKSFVGLEIEKPAKQKQPKALSLKKFKKIVEKKNMKVKPVKEEKKVVKKKTVRKSKKKVVKKKANKKSAKKKKAVKKKAKKKVVKKKTAKKKKVVKKAKKKAKKKPAKKKVVKKKAKKKVVKKKAKKKPAKKKTTKKKSVKKVQKKKVVKKKAKKKVVKKKPVKKVKKKPALKNKVVKKKTNKTVKKKSAKKPVKKVKKSKSKPNKKAKSSLFSKLKKKLKK